MSRDGDRPGDVHVVGAPDAALPGAGLVFIGHVRTANPDIAATPKNPTKARAAGGRSLIEIAPPFRLGLEGLAAYSHVIVLCWLHAARRDLIQITRPADARPKGVFALRSPVRPNPISLSVVRIITVDVAAGTIETDAIDLLDGTPIVDLKPYRPGIDAIPDAVVP